MYLTYRDVRIINELLRCPNKKVSSLCEKMSLTRTQVSYSVQKINGLSESEDIIQIEKGNFYISRENLVRLAQILDEHHRFEYILTEHERVYLILACLVCNGNEIITFQDLLRIIQVSKNTLTHDLKLAAHELEIYQLEMNYSRINGYRIVGEEIKVRRALFNIANGLKTIIDLDNRLEKITGLQTTDIERKIRFLEHKLDIHFSDEGYRFVLINMIFNLCRIRDGFHVKKTSALKVPSEIQDIYKYFVEQDIGEGDKEWLAMLVASSTVIENNTLATDDNLRLCILDFIKEVERNAFLVLDKNDDFIDRLERHIRPAVYRAQMGIHELQQESSDLLDNYKYLLDIVSKSLKPLEDFIGMKMPTVEINYLTMYIGSELLRNGYDIQPQVNVIIVCSSGQATSRMLEYHIRDLFPYLNIIATLSARQIHEVKEPYSAVFSTIPIKTNCPLYLVSPIMSEEERLSLVQRVNNDLFLGKQNNQTVDEIVELVKKYASNFDEKGFRNEVEHKFMMDSFSPIFRRKYPTDTKFLIDFISEGFIQRVSSPESYDDLLITAFKPLIDSGNVHINYLKGLISLSKEEKAHFYVGNGFLIPHLDDNDSVYEDSIGITILTKPFVYEEYEKIHTIIPLAFKSNVDHIKAIHQLFQMIESKETIEVFHNESFEEIIKYIKGFE